jgi:hypothetical protein
VLVHSACEELFVTVEDYLEVLGDQLSTKQT